MEGAEVSTKCRTCGVQFSYAFKGIKGGRHRQFCPTCRPGSDAGARRGDVTDKCAVCCGMFTRSYNERRIICKACIAPTGPVKLRRGDTVARRCINCAGEFAYVCVKGHPRVRCYTCAPPIDWTTCRPTLVDSEPPNPVSGAETLCRRCGVPVRRKSKKAVYCSRECLAWKPPLPQRKCADCGVAVNRNPGGISASRCPECTRQRISAIVRARKDAQKVRGDCTGCGTPIETASPKRMCQSCLQRDSKRALPKREVICAHCQTPFMHFQRVAMFCSMRCKCNAWLARQPEEIERVAAAAKRKAVRDMATVLQRLLRIRQQAAREARHLERARAAALAGEARRTAKCTVCDKPIGSMLIGRRGGRRSYCSAACHHATDAFRDARRRNRQAARHLKRGVTVERFNDREVLERDGWRCQICGTPTPAKLRGTFKPNAPEVDHIVPLSKGGAHSRANTQCACRSCNGMKSDKVVIGQMGLFSTLINESYSLTG